MEIWYRDVFRPTTAPVHPPHIATYLYPQAKGVPPVLLHHFKHNQCLHEQVVLLRVASVHVPTVTPDDRLSVQPIGQGFFRVTLSFGFMEAPSVPAALVAVASCALQLMIGPWLDRAWRGGGRALG